MLRVATVDADWLEKLVERTESLERRAIEAETTAKSVRDDKMMTFSEVRSFFADIDPKTLRKMLADQQVVAYGTKIVLFRRSAIEAYCRRNSIPYNALVATKRRDKATK